MSTAPALDRPRIGPGHEGRAVHLAEVAAWLMERHELPRKDALARVLEHLDGPARCIVYSPAKDGGYAQPVPVDRQWFATPDGNQESSRPGRRYLSLGIELDGPTRGRAAPPPAEPAYLGAGIVGFVEWLRGWAAALAQSGDLRASSGLASWFVVAESEARRLWGWEPETAPAPVPAVVVSAVPSAAPVPTVLTADDVKDYATLCQFMQSYKGKKGYERPLWRDEWVAGARAEVKARGRGGKAAVARELGISPYGLAQVFERHPEPKGTHFDGLGDRSKAAA